MHPFILFEVIECTQDLLSKRFLFQLKHHVFLLLFNVLLSLSSHLIHENFVDEVLVVENVLISNLLRAIAESMVFNVKIPFPYWLVFDAEVKVSVQLENIDFFLKFTKLIALRNFLVKKLNLDINFSEF